MAIIDLYSKRQRRSRGEVSDVYTYDIFTSAFRVQLSYMIQDLLGTLDIYNGHYEPRETYRGIVKALKREYGKQTLANSHQVDAFSELHCFLLQESDVERCLDAIELCYGVGGSVARDRAYLLSLIHI